MEKLEIRNFKAFASGLSLNCTRQKHSLLVYGENGSGKSSLFEAIKLVFFSSKMLQSVYTIGASEELRKNEADTFFRSFIHQGGDDLTTSFDLKINNKDFRSFDTAKFQCFMISNDNLRYDLRDVSNNIIHVKDTINLRRLFAPLFFTGLNVDDYIKQDCNALFSLVNASLKDDFKENCSISIDEDSGDIEIIDNTANLRAKDGLSIIFNEAKLNLIIILLILSLARLLEDKSNPGMHKLLVIDDLISSFDAPYRYFMVKYLITHFENFQKVIFTHNIGFNNLFVAKILDAKVKDKWLFYNIYMTNSGPNIYNYQEYQSAASIKCDFNKGLIPPLQVGNIIRKAFEIEMYEIAKLFHIDATSSVTDIVNRVLNERPLYFHFRRHRKSKILILENGDDLVDKISKVCMNSDSDNKKIISIQQAINLFKSNNDFAKLVPLISDFRFYEKIGIHALSHGSRGITLMSKQEVIDSLLILEKIEELNKEVKNKIGSL